MKTKLDAKELFKVTTKAASTRTVAGVREPDVIETKLVNSDALDYIKKYYSNTEILKIESLGTLWPDEVTVEVVDAYSNRRGYTSQRYRITSPRALIESDIDILIAQDCFMRGQVTGETSLDNYKVENGVFIYSAYSCCDSSD